MTSLPALRKNAVTRAPKKPTISTSEARANFAEALGLAQEESTVIGFDRYGKLVAALVPIDAVRMLAGRGEDVTPAVRNKIERMSRVFLQAALQRHARAGREGREASESPPKAQPKRRKDKRDKKRKAKAAHGKRPRRISRKI